MRTEDNTRPGLIKDKNVFMHTRDTLKILYKETRHHKLQKQNSTNSNEEVMSHQLLST